MSQPQSREDYDEFCRLIQSLCDGNISPEEADTIQERVCRDKEACRIYSQYMNLYASLRRERGSTLEPEDVEPAPVPRHVSANPVLGFISECFRGLGGILSESNIFGLLIAVALPTVLVLVLITLVTLQTKQEPQIVAKEELPEPPKLMVANVVRLHNDKWDGAPLRLGASLYAGQLLCLEQGLAEIELGDGARVILQAPVQFQIRDENAGYLKHGFITATVPPSANGFSVRTPVAMVVDLGTAFGVQVGNGGESEAHVFSGRVKVAARNRADEPARAFKELGVGQAMKLWTDASSNTVKEELVPVAPNKFVRQFPPDDKVDLVDVVCGGDGHGAQRTIAIDGRTGEMTVYKRDTSTAAGFGYRPVGISALIDGVFVPHPPQDGKACQIDSKGTTFEFTGPLSTDTAPLLAGGVLPSHATRPRGDEAEAEIARGLATLGGVCYSDAGHGLLSMHANQGITFDLEAIRRANPGMKVDRFTAVVGNAVFRKTMANPGLADARVIVDGKVRFEKLKLAGDNKAHAIDVQLEDSARFLTLVTTDGGDTGWYDYLIFGDPRLELVRLP